MSSLRDAAAQLFDALDQLGIPYAVGGSLASSIHGYARSTQDVDLVVELTLPRVRELYSVLSPHFYVDDAAMADAIRRGASFNAIHLASGFKFDLFIASRHPLGHDQLAHCRKIQTALLGGDPLNVNVVSAEDIILAKLLWYRNGGEVSERQWNDLLNLEKAQRDRLDRNYLKVQAGRLGVGDLLRRLQEGMEPGSST